VKEDFMPVAGFISSRKVSRKTSANTAQAVPGTKDELSPAVREKLSAMGLELRFPVPPSLLDGEPQASNGHANGYANGDGKEVKNQTASDEDVKTTGEDENQSNGASSDDFNAITARSDLNRTGEWGERYLIVTAERLLVFVQENADKAHIELDVPLSDIIKAELKNLVGGVSLEARLKETRNGANAERIIEILRSSNTYSKELGRAAKQIEHLKEHGKPGPEEDETFWQIRNCPSCGRRFPHDSQVCPFCVNRLQALRRLLSYLGPYKWVAVLSGVLSLATTALSFVPPVVTKTLIDKVFPTRDAASAAAQIPLADSRFLLLELVGVIVLAGIFEAGLNMSRGRIAAFLGARVLHDVRTEVYAQLQRLSLAFYDKREIGAVMSRVQNDVGMLQNFLLDAAENIIISTLTIAIVVIIMFFHSPLLAIVALLPVPFVVIGTNTYWRGLMKLWRRVWHQNSRLGARLADSLGGVRVVRAFAGEKREVEKFVDKSGELRDATVRVEQKAAAFYPTMGFIMGLGLPMTWFLGGNQVLSDQISFGTLFLFTVLLARLYGPVQNLTRLVNFTTRAMTAAERVFEILDMAPEIVDGDNAQPMPHVEGKVEFKDVVFGYDKHRPVLKGVDLKVEPGEMIGLVGHSGAGKSTLINLLMRFYDVDSGAILVDGVDLRNIQRDDVRRQIGVVLQEPYLFHGTIFDNIAYGKPEATPAEIMAAAKAAYAHDFIVSFPDGYDTLVGERGTRLSGGERQRISIARAILHDPRILILDEATASVDTQTEQQIQNALKNLVKGRTVFAIAHRLSTLRNANRLVVMDAGKIAEIGTHDELLEKRGTFYKLVNAQKAMNEITAVGG
jgi:ATP-binding cassette subfamily B protein